MHGRALTIEEVHNSKLVTLIIRQVLRYPPGIYLKQLELRTKLKMVYLSSCNQVPDGYGHRICIEWHEAVSWMVNFQRTSMWLTPLPIREHGLFFINQHFMMHLLFDMARNPVVFAWNVSVALTFLLDMLWTFHMWASLSNDTMNCETWLPNFYRMYVMISWLNQTYNLCLANHWNTSLPLLLLRPALISEHLVSGAADQEGPILI